MPWRTLLRELFLKSLRAVQEAFHDFGVVKMKALDQTFNPEHHEAMFAMEMPGKESNSVFHVMELGAQSGSWPLV